VEISVLESRNLKLSLSFLRVKCFTVASLGLRFVRCFALRSQEDVVTDHLLVSDTEVRVLDKRE
jgi:hypothetical protein